MLAAIPGIEVDMTQNWNRRYRENLERLKSGNLLEVARVVKGLMLRELERGLSTGEPEDAPLRLRRACLRDRTVPELYL